MSASNLKNYLWLAVAFTFPLFSVDFLRAGDVEKQMSLSLPLAIIIVTILLEFVAVLMSNHELPNPINLVGSLLSSLIILFLFLCLFSLLLLGGHPSAVGVIFKLCVGFFCMYGIILFFPKNKIFIEKFWSILIWSSVLLISLLIYRYAFVFKVSYLGIKWGSPTEYGRNQLSFYLVIIFSVSIFYLLSGRKKLISWIPPLVFVTAILYLGSRGAVLPNVLGLFYVIFIRGFGGDLVNVKKLFFPMIAFGLMLWAALWIIPQVVDKPLFMERFDYSDSDKFSQIKDEKRWELLQDGLEAFISSPFLGIGIQNSNFLFKFRGGILYLHNDYLKILCEFGVVGFLLFVGILLSILTKVISKVPTNMKEVSWVDIGIQGALIAVVIRIFFDNIYFTPTLWIFFGLVLASTHRKFTESTEHKFKVLESPLDSI